MKIRIVLSLSALLFLGTFFEVDSSSSSETTSTRYRKGKEPVEEEVTKPFVKPTNHGESSSRKSQKGKEPVGRPTLAEVKANMKSLYGQLAFGKGMIQNDIRRGEYEPFIDMTRESLKEVEKEIIALRPELRRAMGMKYPIDSKKAKCKIIETINQVNLKMKKNDVKLKALEEKGDTGKRYNELGRKQEKLRVELEDLENASIRHRMKIYHYEYPELEDSDIVTTPFDIPR